MAFHIPFNQRNRNHQGPIYIGFNEPGRFRHKFNWWGFNGLWMSLAAFFTAGFLSFIPLLVSLRGLKQKRRKMAVAGTFFSVIGICIAATIAITGISHEMKRENARQQIRQQREMAQLVAKCEPIMKEAIAEFDEYRESNDGYLPSAINGNMVVIKHVDPWGTSLRFEPENDKAVIRSAGPDTEFDTPDDIMTDVQGKTDDGGVLLPLD